MLTDNKKKEELKFNHPIVTESIVGKIEDILLTVHKGGQNLDIGASIIPARNKILALCESIRAEALKEVEEAKNNAYWERNQMVVALSKLYPSVLGRHEESDKTWEDDWRWIVYIEIPVMCEPPSLPMATPDYVVKTMQVSWHIHDSELDNFKHLKVDKNYKWDGHDTAEKYRRLSSVLAKLSKEEE